MLDTSVVNRLLTKLRDPRYGTLINDAKYDISIVEQKLIRASIYLAVVKSADYKKCTEPFGAEGATIKIRSTQHGLQGDLNFKKQNVYKQFIVGQFINILTEVCSSADVLGGLFKDCYAIVDPIYSIPGRTYFHKTLKEIHASTRISNLQGLVGGEPSLLDYLQTLPATPMAGIDLANCNFSYDLMWKLRNVFEHNSYEKLILFIRSQDSVVLRGQPEAYAVISDDADSICGFTDFWNRMSHNKNGSRDICRFGQWILDESKLCFERVINSVADDL